jgi:hypothetical protein
MAKRRNLKKEKAQRNQAYARKFRKRKTPARFSRNRRGRPSEEEGSDDNQNQNQNQNQYNSDSKNN